MALPSPSTPHPCPACGAPSRYLRPLDRYVHDDGSDNRPCWLDMVRGLTHHIDVPGRMTPTGPNTNQPKGSS